MNVRAVSEILCSNNSAIEVHGKREIVIVLVLVECHVFGIGCMYSTLCIHNKVAAADRRPMAAHPDLYST